MKTKKTQAFKSTLFSLLIPLALGFVFGISAVSFIDCIAPKMDLTWIDAMPFVLFLFIFMCLTVFAVFAQLILHEAGHLVCGLMTGYRFSSFRIASFMWVKDHDRLCFKRLSLAGTGGQCLLEPPELIHGRMPYVLYNLGGTLANLLSALLFFGLALCCLHVPVLPVALFLLSAIGLFFGLTNGIPMQNNMVSNDGYNALSLGKDPLAMHSMWVQLQVSALQTKGIRLKDMPEEWFVVPDENGMQNSMAAVVGVFACNRLMDQLRLREADALMETLLRADTAIAGVHRHLLVCDRMFCELISENRKDRIDVFLDKKQRSFMKSMRAFPAVLRTQYAYALLYERDEAKAAGFKEQFEKTAKTYPYAADIEAERELLAITDTVNTNTRV